MEVPEGISFAITPGWIFKVRNQEKDWMFFFIYIGPHKIMFPISFWSLNRIVFLFSQDGIF